MSAVCRLFGLASGTTPVRATFWLLDAPDSIEQESWRNADGTGLGWFDADGTPVVEKEPTPAYRDPEFIKAAIEAESTSFVAHVRWATTGGRAVHNTHPFEVGGLLVAHNGGLGDLAVLERQLGEYRGLVQGETDSERYAALIRQQVDAHDGDVTEGITAAAQWIAERLPVSSLNVVVIAPGELWALRYPDQHALHVIERPAGGGLHVRSTTSSIHSDDIQRTPSVVIASERLDGESGWRMLAPGELVHVQPDLTVTSTLAVPGAPRQLVAVGAENPNVDT